MGQVFVGGVVLGFISPAPVEIFQNLWKSSPPRPVKPLFRDHRFITILIRGKYESENKDFHSFRVRIADLLY
jgi:hypothetical protein